MSILLFPRQCDFFLSGIGFNKLTLSTCKPAEAATAKTTETKAQSPSSSPKKVNMAKTPTKQVPKPETVAKATTSKVHNTSGHGQNVLLCESSSNISKVDKNQSIITDDDTDSIGSSVDTDFINDIMSSATKVNQSKIQKPEVVEDIGTQLKNISISSPAQFFLDKWEPEAQNMSGLSQKFTELDLLQNTTDDYKVHERSKQDDEACQSKLTAARKSLFETSVVTVSSVSIHERKQQHIQAVHVSNADTVERPIEVIVLSDSELESNTGSRDDINKIPFYNVSTETETEKPLTVNTIIMDKVNKFFDNVPDQLEDSFAKSKLEKPVPVNESIYISETSESDNADNDSVAGGQQNISNAKSNEEKTLPDDNALVREADADIFVSAQGSDLQQSKNTDHVTEGQVIAMSVENIADPLPTICSIASDIRESSESSAVVKNTGSSIKITSSNLQSSGEKVSISAQININIQISGLDTSTSESSDSYYSNPVENSSEQIDNRGGEENADYETGDEKNGGEDNFDDESLHANIQDENVLNAEPAMPSLQSRGTETPGKTTGKTLAKTPAKTPVKTPAKTPAKTPIRPPRRTPSKNTPKIPTIIHKKTPLLDMKRFEFVPPKSMTKIKKNDPVELSQAENKVENNGNNSDEDSDKEANDFVIDKSIPVAPKDQLLLHKIYGDAWKTPEVIRSYSAVKGKKMHPQVEQQSQSVITKQEIRSRMSRGFHICECIIEYMYIRS